MNLLQMGEDTLHNEAKLLKKMVLCIRHFSIFFENLALSYLHKMQDLERCKPIIVIQSNL